MSLLKCCECGKDVSEYADKCPNCGCPIDKIKEFILLHDDSKLICIINKKTRDITWIKDELMSLSEDKFYLYKKYYSPAMDDVKVISKYVNDRTFLDSCKFENKVYHELDLTPKQAGHFLYQLIDSDFTLKEFNGESLSEFTQKQVSYINSKPKCPVCGSTNISKISTMNRATSIVGLGILSKKIGKQWKCNNPKCKHLW